MNENHVVILTALTWNTRGAGRAATSHARLHPAGTRFDIGRLGVGPPGALNLPARETFPRGR